MLKNEITKYIGKWKKLEKFNPVPENKYDNHSDIDISYYVKDSQVIIYITQEVRYRVRDEMGIDKSP